MQTYIKISGALIVLGSLSGCGWFDYNADEFKDVTEAAKNFENIDENEILGIMDRLAESQAPSFSTAALRGVFASIATATRPAALAAGGFALAETMGKDPCLGMDGQPVADIVKCQTFRTRYYYREVSRLVSKVATTAGDVTKAMVLILGDTKSASECGVRYEGLQPSAKFQAILPAKWKGATLDFILPPKNLNGICVEEGDIPFRGFEVLIKRLDDSGTLIPFGHLKLRQVVDASAAVDYGTTAEFYMTGKEGEVPNSDQGTIAYVNVKIKDADNLDIKLYVKDMRCLPEYVSIPNSFGVGINVTAGKWNGFQFLKPKRFGATSCDAATSNVNFFQDNQADATHLSGSFSIIEDLPDGFRTSNLQNFCAKFGALCQDQKVLPSLAETPSSYNDFFCFGGGDVEPIWSSKSAGVCGSFRNDVYDHLEDVEASISFVVKGQLPAAWAKTIVQ